jgi:orotidine-5'-phosphate decarboxylase
MAEVIVALDLPAGSEAIRLLDRLPEARWVKVGPVLMIREGARLVATLVDRGLRVFLDLKWHDIPNTVAEAVTAARELGVSLATVHTLGGSTMMETAAAAARPDLELVGVTVLTSHDAESFARALGHNQVDLSLEAARLARAGIQAGLRGAVCSAHEIAAIRRQVGSEPLLVVPGIRRASDASSDQVRVATAKDAAALGATHLVVGRPILKATDPAAAFHELAEEARCVPS